MQPLFRSRRDRLRRQREEAVEAAARRSAIPENGTQTCPGCGAECANQELVKTEYVCPHCGYHLPIGAYLRLSLLLDPFTFQELWPELTAPNALEFPGYEGKLTAQREKTALSDAAVAAVGKLDGRQAVFAVLATLLDEGDEILVPDPVWLNYINVPNLLGARAVTYSLKEENGYQMDFGEIRAKITPKTRAVVIVTPNNPTGGVLEEDVLKELASIVQEHDLMVIADEIYERLVYDGCKHVSIASLPGMKERTFTMNGMSKAYAMDGWRLGYVAAPEEYITAMNKFHQHNTTCAPSFVQAAAIAALTQEGDEVKEMVKEYQRRRDYAVKAINDIDGIHCLCPKGAFYIFINCKELGKTSAELSQYFLEEAKIALVPGDVFGPGGEGYLRMSFAASYEDIVEGCARLKEAVARLGRA